MKSTILPRSKIADRHRQYRVRHYYVVVIIIIIIIIVCDKNYPTVL